jgi:hypothetical protein
MLAEAECFYLLSVRIITYLLKISAALVHRKCLFCFVQTSQNDDFQIAQDTAKKRLPRVLEVLSEQS